MNGDSHLAPLRRRVRRVAYAVLGLALVALVAVTCLNAIGSAPRLTAERTPVGSGTPLGLAHVGGKPGPTTTIVPGAGPGASPATDQAGAARAEAVTAALAPVASAAHTAAMPAPIPLPGIAPPPTIADTCTQDVSTRMQEWLNNRPAGTIVRAPAGACFLVNEGLKLVGLHDITIIGGTWEDQSVPVANADPNQMNALFWFVGGSGITVENLLLSGVNPGGYDPAGAFAAGIRSDGVSGLNVSDVFIQHVYGDGVNFEPLRASNDLSSTIVRPSENVVLDNVWIDGSGRQGVTLADLSDATLTGVVFRNIGIDVFDVEADQWDEGAQNVDIEGCKVKGGAGGLFFANEGMGSGSPWTSNVRVDHCNMTQELAGDAILINNGQSQSAARYAGGQRGPFTFTNDVLRCGNSAYVSCVEVSDGNVTVDNSMVWVPDGTVPEPIYHATDGSTVTFDNDVATGYNKPGWTDSSSSANVQGGTWTPHPGDSGSAPAGSSTTTSTTAGSGSGSGSGAPGSTTSTTSPHPTTTSTTKPKTTTTAPARPTTTTTTTLPLLSSLGGSGSTKRK